MIKFIKEIVDINIVICIENELYIENKKIFNKVLFSFNRYDSYDEIEDVLYLYKYRSKINKRIRPLCRRKCDTTNQNWLYYALCAITQYIQVKLNCTILHGSCLIYNNKKLLILGNRYSGKTTMVKNILQSQSAILLDDDNIYIYKSSIIGFGLPLALRQKDDTDNNIIGITYDNDQNLRYIYPAFNTIYTVNSVDIIIFPHYLHNANESFKFLPQKDTIQLLLNNIHYTPNMTQLYYDICKIGLNSQAVIMEYSNTNNMFKMLNEIL